MAVKEKAYYRVQAATLADWLESQPECWWDVDGDPLLTSQIDFPCPSDELAPAIRGIGGDLFVRDKNAASNARGEIVGIDRLDELIDVRNRHHKKTLCLSWADSEIDWLLTEDRRLL